MNGSSQYTKGAHSAHAGLNAQQQEAVLHGAGPLLVLAGAGSGKTRIVTQRIAHLLREGMPAHHILAVTFTNKAAEEMSQRVRALTDSSVLVCTFHSLGARILREAITALGYERNFVIYDEDDSLKLLKGILKKLGSEKEVDAKTYRSRISAAKNSCLAPEDLQLENVDDQTGTVYREYQQRLQECNAVDFDDLLFLPVQLFRKHPELLAHYQARWQYLMIDEYQDTNAAQYQLATLLVSNTHNIFVVGDPDQSIYSWRGADIENILNFERDFPGAKVIRLEQNYRSRNIILQAANALISNNSQRLDKALWSDLGEGEPIGVFLADHDHMEADFVVEQARKLRALHGIPLHDMCIFYRTNAQSRVLEDVLLAARMPYQIIGGLSFYQRREIKDLLAFLRMVASDCDAMSFARTINLPKRGIGDTTVAKLIQAASAEGIALLQFCQKLLQQDVHNKVRLTTTQREGLENYLQMIYGLRAFSAEELSLHMLLNEIVIRSGYLQVLKEDPESAQERKENIDELIGKAMEWEEQQSEDVDLLVGFLEELSLKSAVDDGLFDGDQLNLMTIHHSKGLEFRAVFIIGMEEDLFPHLNSKATIQGIEEERRLCYVGLTRAREHLFLSAAHTRFLWGGLRNMRPSRFLQELPKEWLRLIKTRPRR